jgi:hypothetical protein
MNDSPRGAYTPHSDQPLSFDARAPVRGSRPVPMTLIVSAVILVTLIVAIFLLYRGGTRGEGDAPQPVGEVVGAMKGPAPQEAIPADPAAGLQIYRGDAPVPPEGATFAPPPETPQARPTVPVGAADPIGAALAQGEAAIAKAPAPKAPAPKAVVAAPAPKTVAVASAGGGASVQIGAFSSEALADKGWVDAARIAPGMAAGKGKRVEPVQVQGATLYRTNVTGFASRAEADAFCAALKAAGKSCFTR